MTAPFAPSASGAPMAKNETWPPSITMARLLSAYGLPVPLRAGNGPIACPFHQGGPATLRIDAAADTFKCDGCDASGDVVDFVQRAEAISRKHALQLLKAEAFEPGSRTIQRAKHATTPRGQLLLSATATREEALHAVADYYHRTLMDDRDLLERLDDLGVSESSVIRLRLGFCNRTLGYHLPAKNRRAGGAIRGTLQELGLLRKTGHEHFRGCITIPVLSGPEITGMLGFPLHTSGALLSLPGTRVPSGYEVTDLGSLVASLSKQAPASPLRPKAPPPPMPKPEDPGTAGSDEAPARPALGAEAEQPPRPPRPEPAAKASADEQGQNEPTTATRKALAKAPPRPTAAPAPAEQLPPVEHEPEVEHEPDAVMLHRVVEHYHATLVQDAAALRFVRERGIDDDTIRHFRIGYANRSLSRVIPARSLPAGAVLRDQLTRLGVFRTTGSEHLHGAITVPVTDRRGAVLDVYGRRTDRRNDRPQHLTLNDPPQGVFNLAGLAPETILCHGIFDALVLWRWGFRHVTASFAPAALSAEHVEAIRAAGVRRLLVAFGQGQLPDAAARRIAGQLEAFDVSTYRVRLPAELSIEDYAREVSDPARALPELLGGAEWLGGVQDAQRQGQGQRPLAPSKAEAREMVEDPAAAAPEVDGDEANFQLGPRHWRVRGLSGNLGTNRLKLNLLVRRAATAEGEPDRFHVDVIDLYLARQRWAFARQAAIELGVDQAAIKSDLGKLLLQLEALQAEQRRKATTPEQTSVQMSEEERQEALQLLRSPDLLDRIADDIVAAGVVGEADNALVGYLAATSRKLDRPLAVVIQSSSAAGKSSLMDAILALLPEEDRTVFSAMTAQSLYYLAPGALKHRVLAIAEEEGASDAAYALKLLQSQGELTIASTGKDSTTGRLQTEQYRVEGPVQLFITTTAIDLDEELLNRCIVLSVDEGREQTRAIQALQRQRQTLQGMLEDEGRAQALARHRNAQRLLQPLRVVNPYAEQLSFADHQTRTRRDHAKYLSLIQAVTLLHQHQRDIKEAHVAGKVVRYVEATPQDIAVANRLAHAVLGRSLDELPPVTRKLLTELHALASEECRARGVPLSQWRFTRRHLRDCLSTWGDTALKTHLRRLVDLEYLLAHRSRLRRGLQYELVYDGSGQDGDRFLSGLIVPDNRGHDRSGPEG